MNRPVRTDAAATQAGGIDQSTDRVIDGMRDRARAGHPVRAEDFLDPASSDRERMLDLVYCEYLIRCETKEPPSIAELMERFPHLAEKILRQIGLHNAIESEKATRSIIEPTKADAPSDTPQRIGRYRVLNRLGSGGQATAYRAFHPDLQRDVVVKIAHHAASGGIESLRNEARTLASLDHPGLVRVHDFDLQDGIPFIVMESVGGRSLDVVAAASPISPTRAAEIVALSARAAAHGHFRGVVHRDLKPENILIDDAGKVRIIDFGLATLLGTTVSDDSQGGVIAGTLRFMAPEQAQGATALIGPRTDVFGLGGVLFFLLTGSPLYSGQRLEALNQAATGDWDRRKLDIPRVSAGLKTVCTKALAPNPSDRYQTADDLAEALDRATRSRQKPVILLIAMLLVAGLVMVGWQMAHPDPVSQPRIPAAVTQPEFDVRVWDENRGRYRELIHMLPLTTGERLRYEVAAPTGRHLALFALDSDGGVRELAVQPPRSEPGSIAFPDDPTQASELLAPDGTVALLLCGRAEEAVSIREIRSALGSEKWPLLPKESIVKVERGKVYASGTMRSVSPPTGQPDPESDVLRRLDAARVKLGSSYDVLAGIAFSHR